MLQSIESIQKMHDELEKELADPEITKLERSVKTALITILKREIERKKSFKKYPCIHALNSNN